MSLTRRLMLALAVVAPLVWLIAAALAWREARHEVDEMADVGQVRLARHLLELTLNGAPLDAWALPPLSPRLGGPLDAVEDTLTSAVWIDGRPVGGYGDARALPYRDDLDGFVETTVAGRAWRVYYLREPRDPPRRIVAIAQTLDERREITDEVLKALALPWLAALPALLLMMAAAVRYALGPLRALTAELEGRGATDLGPITAEAVPVDLRPLVLSINRLFERIDAALRLERRFTADAAHELRTPIAAVRAQWDAVRLARTDTDRERASDGVRRGLERLDRLATQMLAMARADSTGALESRPIDWPAVVGAAIEDSLPLIDARGARIDVDWPPGSVAPMPLDGDPALIASLLRNLIDNAVRYGPPGSTVRIALEPDRLVVEDGGPGLSPTQREGLGERFRRPDGHTAPGSGLGASIVLRVASLHGLGVDWQAREDGPGLRVVVARAVPGAH